MPWRPGSPGERPTLGFYALDWLSANLAASDRVVYEPFVPTREQAEFVLRFYELDPVSGRRNVRRGVLSRSRGWGKSPFLSGLALLEGLGDVVPDGWDADGQPVGRPWASVRTPLVFVAAASEEQTRNSWDALLEMVSMPGAPVLDNYPGLEPMGTFVNLPLGRIQPVTSSVTSTKGARAVFTVADQTEQWTPGNGGVRLAETLVNNATKVGGSIVESPNAFTPGLGSVAENTARAYLDQVAGRAKLDRGLLYDHREAPDVDVSDRESLLAGLRFAYGDSSDHPGGCVLHDPPCPPGWAPIETILARFWDTDADEQTSRSDWLNQITNASDAFLSQPEWAACRDTSRSVVAGDPVVLGFDGSRGRARGKPDATALVGCRVSDGHLFELFVDEAPDVKSVWVDWQPNIVALEAAIGDAFKRFTVVGFYADPARDWRSHVDGWEAEYGGRVPKSMHVSPSHPFEWWMLGGRASLVERAVELFEGAVRNRDLSHDGGFRLTEHMLNARRRLVHGKLGLGKASDYSERKIDAAVAAVLAYQGRVDAIANGFVKSRRVVVPSRIR